MVEMCRCIRMLANCSLLINTCSLLYAVFILYRLTLFNMFYVCGSHNLCTFINEFLITISITLETPLGTGLSYSFHSILNDLLSIKKIPSSGMWHRVDLD
jgi:hypothetical protein